MNWLRHLLNRSKPSAKAPAPHPLAVPFCGDEMQVVVTQSDVLALRQFLGSAAGVAIKSQLSVAIAQADAKAVDSGDRYECGRARGWREATSLLISLSQPPTAHQPEKPEFVVPGDDAELETESPSR